MPAAPRGDGGGAPRGRVGAHPRVECHARPNVGELPPGAWGPPFDIVVADLSFISLRLVLPALLAYALPREGIADQSVPKA